MAKKQPKPQVPETLKDLVRDVVNPVSASDVESYGKLRQIQDRSHQIRTVVRAWKDQQVQDRLMRERYANYLITAMGLQALLVNVVFVLMGVNLLNFEPWTARTFITAVFAEIAAMVSTVVKYLFTPSSDKVLQFLAEKKKTSGRGR